MQTTTCERGNYLVVQTHWWRLTTDVSTKQTHCVKPMTITHINIRMHTRTHRHTHSEPPSTHKFTDGRAQIGVCVHLCVCVFVLEQQLFNQSDGASFSSCCKWVFTASWLHTTFKCAQTQMLGIFNQGRSLHSNTLTAGLPLTVSHGYQGHDWQVETGGSHHWLHMLPWEMRYGAEF